ncbi:MAG TPA: hypothetical protein VMX55_11385 [candidate division Zixibacteria bacterium]|nr:hypothetical protein [candidate division Zixibacteria bacterium]
MRKKWKNILFRITILFILFSFTTNQIISISPVTSLSGEFTLSYYEYANIETEMISPEFDIYWTISIAPSDKYLDVLLMSPKDFLEWAQMIETPSYYVTNITIETLSLHARGSASGIYETDSTDIYMIVLFVSDATAVNIQVNFELDYEIPSEPIGKWLYILIAFIVVAIIIIGFFIYRQSHNSRIRERIQNTINNRTFTTQLVEGINGAEQSNEFTCPNCFSSLPTNKIRCHCCGAIVRCIICLKPVKGASELSGCPKCDAAGHKDHMRDWVKLHHRCPLCHSALSTIELVQIKNEK